MSIFERAKNVIASNVGAVVSSLRDGESPQKQLQSALVAAMATEKSLRAQCEALGAEVERWAKRAELAIAAGDDALARKALHKKQQLEQDLANTTRSHGEASQVVERMRAERANPQAMDVVNVGSDPESVIDRMEAKVGQLEESTHALPEPPIEAPRAPYSHVTPEPEPPTPPVRFRVN